MGKGVQLTGKAAGRADSLMQMNKRGRARHLGKDRWDKPLRARASVRKITSGKPKPNKPNLPMREQEPRRTSKTGPGVDSKKEDVSHRNRKRQREQKPRRA
jgi:hypothetical protein